MNSKNGDVTIIDGANPDNSQGGLVGPGSQIVAGAILFGGGVGAEVQSWGVDKVIRLSKGAYQFHLSRPSGYGPFPDQSTDSLICLCNCTESNVGFARPTGEGSSLSGAAIVTVYTAKTSADYDLPDGLSDDIGFAILFVRMPSLRTLFCLNP